MRLLMRLLRGVPAQGQASASCSQTRGPRARPLTVLVQAAKKKGGGGKKGGGPDPSRVIIPKTRQAQPYESIEVVQQNLLMIESYRRKLGRPIMDSEIEISEAMKALWEAPFAILAHDQPQGEEPRRFVYANQAALDLWEGTWEEVVGMPSVQSAPEDAKIVAERQAFLDAAMAKGSCSGIDAERQTVKGNKIHVWGATLFNVESPTGTVMGQAVVIPKWTDASGALGGPEAAAEGLEGAEAGAGAGPGSDEAVAAAEAAVAEQAGAVRRLKEEGGLANASPEVQAGVAELQARKARLEALQQRRDAAAQDPALSPAG